MEFDPSQPYDVVHQTPEFDSSQPYETQGAKAEFDPGQPFEVVPDNGNSALLEAPAAMVSQLVGAAEAIPRAMAGMGPTTAERTKQIDGLIAGQLHTLKGWVPAKNRDWTQTLDFNQIDSTQRGISNRRLEYYQAADPSNPKPGKPTIEIFDPSANTSDVAGELLAHYLPGVDKTVAKIRNDILSAITPRQKTELRGDFDVAVKEGLVDKGDGFEQWILKQGGDSFFRGFPTGQWPADVYTPEQKDLYARLDTYLASNEFSPNLEGEWTGTYPPSPEETGKLFALQTLLRQRATMPGYQRQIERIQAVANKLGEVREFTAKNVILPGTAGVLQVNPARHDTTTAQISRAVGNVAPMVISPAVGIASMLGNTFSEGADQAIAAAKAEGETDPDKLANVGAEGGGAAVDQAAPVLGAYALGGPVAAKVATKLAPAAGPVVRGLVGGTAAATANLAVSGTNRAIHGEPVVGNLEQNTTDILFGAHGGLRTAQGFAAMSRHVHDALGAVDAHPTATADAKLVEKTRILDQIEDPGMRSKISADYEAGAAAAPVEAASDALAPESPTGAVADHVTSETARIAAVAQEQRDVAARTAEKLQAEAAMLDAEQAVTESTEELKTERAKPEPNGAKVSERKAEVEKLEANLQELNKDVPGKKPGPLAGPAAKTRVSEDAEFTADPLAQVPAPAEASVVTTPISIPASAGLTYDLGHYDAKANKMNGKHTVPKSGRIDEKAFKRMGGKSGPLKDTEIELYKALVPDAFAEGKVDLGKLTQGLQENGPAVEVHKLTRDDTSPSRLAQATHRLDTEWPGWREANDTDAPTPELRQLAHDVSTAEEIQTTPRPDARYSFVGPKPESEMPGYVEGLVRVPLPPDTRTDGVFSGGRPGIKYAGPHFGSEDTNVLAFYRGYEETLPDGTKAFHVIEVQSDWGQEQRTINEGNNQPKGLRQGASHPLLKVYESLALKAAIQHAKEVGATKVILSDAETAMMTEGHDRVTPRYVPEPGAKPVQVTEPYPFNWVTKLPDGWTWVNKQSEIAADPSGKTFQLRAADTRTGKPTTWDDISSPGSGLWQAEVYAVPVEKKIDVHQEKGMRLHYDQTLPSTMERLTGEKGEKVEIGEHKTARPGNQGGEFTGAPVVGSPVFRENGAPKTQITGRIYDISKVPGELPLAAETNAKRNNIDAERKAMVDTYLGDTGNYEKLFARAETFISKHSIEGQEPGDLVAMLYQKALTKPSMKTPLDIEKGAYRFWLDELARPQQAEQPHKAPSIDTPTEAGTPIAEIFGDTTPAEIAAQARAEPQESIDLDAFRASLDEHDLDTFDKLMVKAENGDSYRSENEKVLMNQLRKFRAPPRERVQSIPGVDPDAPLAERDRKRLLDRAYDTYTKDQMSAEEFRTFKNEIADAETVGELGEIEQELAQKNPSPQQQSGPVDPQPEIQPSDQALHLIPGFVDINEPLAKAWRASQHYFRTFKPGNWWKAWYNAADNEAALFATRKGNDIKGQLRKAMGRKENQKKLNELDQGALSQIVEAQNNPAKLAVFRAQIKAAQGSLSIKKSVRWTRASVKALQEIDHAEKNFARLAPIADEYTRIMTDQVDLENNNGIATNFRKGYVPHIQEFDTGFNMPFEKAGGGGAAFKKVRSFDTFADSIEAGVTPRTTNAVTALENRLRRGNTVINRQKWAEAGRSLIDPTTNRPLVTDLIVEKHPKTNDTMTSAPRGYQMRLLGNRPIAVHQGYASIFDALTTPSIMSQHMATRGLMWTAGTVKHGLLLFDTFHLGRLAFYQLPLRGSASFKQGLLALDYSAAELTAMQRRGELPQGVTAQDLIARKDNLQKLVSAGYNLGGVQEAMFAGLVRKIPLVGGFNRFVFDKFQRGGMVLTGLMEFDRQRAAHPKLSDQEVARMVSKDLNTRFGNLRKEGWLTSDTHRDLAQLVFLAPSWNEGLLKSEYGAGKQLLQAGYDLATQRKLRAGTLLKGSGTLMLGVFAMNQLINYITRGHPTWQNKEEGLNAKLSAWIPDFIGGGPGFFLNPLTLPAELTHQTMEVMDRGKTALQAVGDVAGYKFGPILRVPYTFKTRTDRFGRPLNSDWDVIKEMVADISPVPISGQSVISAVTSIGKGKVTEPYKGAIEKQLFASGGVKLNSAPSDLTRVMHLATEFNRTKGITPDPRYSASDYTDLTQAIRVNDDKRAVEEFAKLVKKKTQEQIYDHYINQVERPFTGSDSREEEFLESLTPGQREAYDLAVKDREALRDAFMALDLQAPEPSG